MISHHEQDDEGVSSAMSWPWKHVICFVATVSLVLLNPAMIEGSSIPVSCSTQGVVSTASSLSQSYLNLILSPASRIEQIRSETLSSLEQGALDTTLMTTQSYLFSRLLPVVATPAEGTFGQQFINYTNSTITSQGFAWVDVGATRLSDFLLTRYNALGTQQVDLRCVVNLRMNGLLPFEAVTLPGVGCFNHLNQTQVCEQFPARCSAPVRSLNAQYPGLGVGELGLQYTLVNAVSYLSYELVTLFPYVAVAYTNDMGAAMFIPNVQNKCSIMFSGSCALFTLVSLMGSDMTFIASSSNSLYQAFTESGLAPSFSFWNPTVFNARRADIWPIYFAVVQSIFVVLEVPIQYASLNVTSALSANVNTADPTKQFMFTNILKSVFPPEWLNGDPRVRPFVFVVDHTGSIYLVDATSASLVLCSTQISKLQLPLASRPSKCNNASVHTEYLSGAFSGTWNLASSEHVDIRNYLNGTGNGVASYKLRLATPAEYNATAATLDNIATAIGVAQPFLNWLDTVVLDSVPYYTSVQGFAIRSYLSLYVFVGIPTSFVNSRAKWSVASTDSTNTNHNNADFIIQFRPEDVLQSNGGNASLVLTVINAGQLPIPFSFFSSNALYAAVGAATVQATTPSAPLAANSSAQIIINLSGAALLSLLSSSQSFSYALTPGAADGGLCVNAIPGTIQVSYRWLQVIDSIPVSAQQAVLVLTSFLLLGVVGLFAHTISRRDAVEVRASTWFTPLIMQMGLALMLVSNVFFVSDATDGVCRNRAWLLGCGSVTVMTPLATRMHRIKAIFNQQKFHFKKFSNVEVLIIIVFALSLGVMLSAITIYPASSSDSTLHSELVLVNNDNTNYIAHSQWQCSSEWQRVLVAVGGFALCLTLLCSRLAWATRKVPNAYNDAMKVLILDMFLIAFGGVLLPFQFFLTDALQLALLRCFAIMFAVILCVVLLHSSFIETFMSHSSTFSTAPRRGTNTCPNNAVNNSVPKKKSNSGHNHGVSTDMSARRKSSTAGNDMMAICNNEKSPQRKPTSLQNDGGGCGIDEPAAAVTVEVPTQAEGDTSRTYRGIIETQHLRTSSLTSNQLVSTIDSASPVTRDRQTAALPTNSASLPAAIGTRRQLVRLHL